MTDLIKAAEAMAEQLQECVAYHQDELEDCDGGLAAALMDEDAALHRQRIEEIRQILSTYRQVRESAEERIQARFNALVSEVRSGFESGDLQFEIGNDGAARPFKFEGWTPCGNDWARAIVSLCIYLEMDSGGY